MKTRFTFALGIVALSILAACQHPTSSSGEPYFSAHVKPILEQHCLRCHTGNHPPAGLNLTTRDLAMTSHHRSGKTFIAPGKPDASLLLTAIARNGSHPQMMPRATLSLTDDQIGTLREWIEDGAHWPSGDAGRLHHVSTGENR